MKTYLKIWAVLIFVVCMLGLVLPWCFSGGNEQVFIGVVLLIVSPLIVVKILKVKK